ncbi:MAG TPA: IPT/TIG domain-containing protein [Actinomycetota bacterium]|nr:IPT/TIG domain-containing protein [Actinomycetota bacterium]
MFSAKPTHRRQPRTLFALSCIALWLLPGVARAAAPSISSFALTQGVGVPVITGFSPDGGTWKTTVTITGSGFTGTSSVRFNGKEASFFVASDSTITARVPSGAGIGPIRVANAAGVDVSDADFQFRRLRHRVVLKMHLEDHLMAIGRVTLPHAGARARVECAAGRLVTIQRKIAGVFTSIGDDESEGIEGRFQVALPDRRGEYRAIIEVKRTPNRKCLPDRSLVRTHEHA